MPASAMSPSDAVVAIRSFPRRFRRVVGRPDDDQHDPDEISRRAGPDGRSAADHLVAADRVLALLAQAVEQARAEDEPVVDAAFADLADPSGPPSESDRDAEAPVADLLDRFEGTASHAADRVDGVATDDWSRPVRVAGDGAGGAPILLELVQAAVDAAASHLRAAERTIDAVA